MKKIYYFLCVVFCFCSLSILAFAAEPAIKTKGAPTRVTSDKMRYNAETRNVVFSGNVKAVRPDFTLTSLFLTVYIGKPDHDASSTPSGGLGLDGGKVEKIVAEKNVRITMEGGRVGTCETATYTMSDEKIVMEGNPVLTEGPNVVKGKKITFFSRENRMEIDGAVAVDFVTKEKASPAGK